MRTSPTKLPATGPLAGASAALVALVLVGHIYRAEVGPFPGERGVTQFLLLGPNGHVALLADLISYLGDPLVAAVLVILLVAATWEEAGPCAASLVAASPGVVVLTKVLKAAVGSGPAASHTVALVHYPSGTTAFVTSLFGVVGWLAWQGRHRVATLACALLLAAVGPSVVAIGEHYPSDVVAGYATGAAWVLAVAAVARRKTM